MAALTLSGFVCETHGGKELLLELIGWFRPNTEHLLLYTQDYCDGQTSLRMSDRHAAGESLSMPQLLVGVLLQDINNQVDILAAYSGCLVAIVLLLLSRSILFNGLCNSIVLGLVALPS